MSDVEDSAIDIIGSTPEELQALINSLREEVTNLRQLLAEREAELAQRAAIASQNNSGIEVSLPSANGTDTQQSTPKRKRRWLCELNPVKYFNKWKGERFFGNTPLPHWTVLLTCWIASFVGISLIGLLNVYAFQPIDKVGWIASMGAVAALIYAVPSSPLAQPRCVFFGNLLSAVIGMGFRHLFLGYPSMVWLAAALAVSLSLVVMHITRTMHPPGGATALAAVIGGDEFTRLGWWYILVPVLVNITIMSLVSLLITNFAKKMRYPLHWL